LLGKSTRRFFRSSVMKGGGPTDGTVVGFLPPEADGPPLFKNLHGADGELEVITCANECKRVYFAHQRRFHFFLLPGFTISIGFPLL